MQGLFIFLCVCALFGVGYIFMLYNSQIKIKKIIKARWGKHSIEKTNYDKIDSVSEYWKQKMLYKESQYYIDKITWNDLSMDEVFKRINNTFSSVGAEYLYARLHEPIFNAEELKAYEEIIQTINSSDSIREKLSMYINRIGKCDFNGVCDFLFDPKGKKLNNEYLFYFLSVLPLVSIIIYLLNNIVGLAILAIVCILNLLVTYKYKFNIEAQLISLEYIVRIVAYSKKLSKIKNIKLLEKIHSLYIKAKEMGSFVNVVITKPVGDLAFLVEIIKGIFMVDIITYNRLVEKMCKNCDVLHELWQEIGKLDSAISIASYRNGLEFYTVPNFVNNDKIIFEWLFHPLIEKAICNDLTLQRNLIITGSNASGKSTFIKAVAINIIFAQTINTCLAKSFNLKPSFVITSMAVNDSIVDGDSYFVAEIKSLKRILMKVNSDIRCICFVDEILRGTNTTERIAASVSIIKWLSERNCICLTASHDIELAVLLKEVCDNFHFRENVSEYNGITFDYKIHKGYSTTTNAIKLLEVLDYPSSIIAESKKYVKNCS